MIETDIDRISFQNMLETLYSQMKGSSSLQKIRAAAWDSFLKMGLPTQRSELYRYVKMRNFFSHSYILAQPTSLEFLLDPYLAPESSESALVFVNGFFSPALSKMKDLPKKLMIQPLEEALQGFGAFLNNQWLKSIKEEVDPLAILNTCLHPQGLFIYLPPRAIVEKPIQILNLVHGTDLPLLVTPRIHIFAGGHSKATFLANQATLSGENYAINTVVDISLDEGAKVEYIQSFQNSKENVWHFDASRAYLKRNASLKVVSTNNGGTTVRQDYKVILSGENGEALLNGVWMLNDKKEAHTHVLMEHQAPYCRSMQLFKGILNNFSRSSFEGKILVRQPAQKTEAYQLNHNLLLSQGSQADSKPNLEIFADDVKASHGATVGQLDQEQIFYMKTRGYTDLQAKHLLVKGFCEEVLSQITVPSVHVRWEQLLAKTLEEGKTG